MKVQAITICLDNISSLPPSKFPDLPEEKKVWLREKIPVSRQVRLFNFLPKEKRPEVALDWF